MAVYAAGRKYEIALSILFCGHQTPIKYVFGGCETDDIANKAMREAYKKAKADIAKGDKAIELSDFDTLLPVENICYIKIICQLRD